MGRLMRPLAWYQEAAKVDLASVFPCQASAALEIEGAADVSALRWR
jgi:hypothetical protein